MGLIQLDSSNCTEIMNKLGNYATELIVDNGSIDTGKMSSEMTDEICRIFQLYTEMIYSYHQLLLYDKERILEAKNDFISLDNILGSRIMIK